METSEVSGTTTPGAKLRAIRKSFGLTIKELAEKIGGNVHFTTISKLERGTMNLSFEWADRIADVFAINPLEILADNYDLRNFNSVPLYFWYSWTPEGGLLQSKQLGWIPTMGGGPLSFALGFYPSREYDDLSVMGLNSVIDPDRKSLDEGALYAVYMGTDLGPMIGTFMSNPARFELVDEAGQVILGEQYAVVIGRIVFQCRTLP